MSALQDKVAAKLYILHVKIISKSKGSTSQALLQTDGNVMLQVATLTRYLQSTNEDLLSTQKAVEILEVSNVAMLTQSRMSSTAMPNFFRTNAEQKGKDFRLPSMPAGRHIKFTNRGRILIA